MARGASAPEPLLETREVTKHFGGVVAVNGLSLAVSPGEIRGLIGPNGSGKTTAVNLLSGVHRVDGGEIRLSGEPKLFGNMTVLENILVPAMAALDRGDPRPMSEILDRAGRLLDFVMLAELRDALAKELSGGQAMLAQIARALMIRPLRLLLMDEPFAGVHATIRKVIIDAVLHMNREEGVTILIVSHEMAELRRLCSRVSVMHEGRLIAEGSLDEVANDGAVLAAYLGR